MPLHFCKVQPDASMHKATARSARLRPRWTGGAAAGGDRPHSGADSEPRRHKWHSRLRFLDSHPKDPVQALSATGRAESSIYHCFSGSGLSQLISSCFFVGGETQLREGKEGQEPREHYKGRQRFPHCLGNGGWGNLPSH